MLELERAELDAAYDAVDALLRLADDETFPFRIGIVDETRWTQLVTPPDRNPVTRGLGTERFELVRCPTTLAPNVLRRVVDMAKAPIFHDRCRNRQDDDGRVDLSASLSVIYLLKYTEMVTDAGPEEPTVPGVPRAISGMRPKAHAAKSA